MKKNFTAINGPAFGLSFEVAAAPAPVAAPAPAAAAPAAAPFSFFSNIPGRDEPAAAAPAAAAAAPAPEAAAAESFAATAEKPYAVTDDAGKPIANFATEAEAQAHIEAGKPAAGGVKTAEELAAEQLAIETGEPDAAAAPAGSIAVAPDAILATPIYGRFKTVKEAEAGFQRSEQEGVRLANENKTLKAEAVAALATRESDLAVAKAELETARKTPPFKELTKEEYSALAKDSPEEAIEYRFAKEKHDKEVQDSKDYAVHQVRERAETLKATRAEINRVVGEMDADKNEYPMFRQMDPLMGKIHEILGGDADSPLSGDPRAVNLLYLASLGTLYKGLLKKGKIAKADATEEAKKAAAAAATSAAAPAGGSGAGGVPPKVKTARETADDQWRENIRNAGQPTILKFDN